MHIEMTTGKRYSTVQTIGYYPWESTVPSHINYTNTAMKAVHLCVKLALKEYEKYYYH